MAILVLASWPSIDDAKLGYTSSWGERQIRQAHCKL